MTPTSAVCFARRQANTVADHGIETHALAPAAARALANALPYLQCGEESAVHAFGRRLAGVIGPAERLALDSITADEQRHANWLEALAAALPAPLVRPNAGAMAAFFRRLLTRDPALHFARIAALDLAVCAILRPLAAPCGALATAPAVVSGLAAIRRDEARHVRVARHCAGALGFGGTDQRALDLAMRAELAGLIAPVQLSLGALGFGGFDAAPRHARH